MQIGKAGEFALINKWDKIIGAPKHSKVLLGIGDDAALLRDLKQAAFSCDMLVEDIHFRREWMSPQQLGWKSMAVNISDIAAMGANPVAAIVSLALPPQTDAEWIEHLYEGFADAARQFRCDIVGGDTVKAQQIVINISIIGEQIGKQPLRRDSARAGDIILVTGNLGDSAAGLNILWNEGVKENPTNSEIYCVERHLCPTPRGAEIRAALESVTDKIHAAIDISDGIAGDAAHIAERSRLDLEIDVAKLPISAQCGEIAQSQNVNPLQWALAGGEDYELLLCADAASADAIIDSIQAATGTQVSVIGVCKSTFTDAPQVRFFDDGALMAPPRSWDHF